MYAFKTSFYFCDGEKLNMPDWTSILLHSTELSIILIIKELKFHPLKHDRQSPTKKRPTLSNRTISVANWHRQDERLRGWVISLAIKPLSLVLCDMWYRLIQNKCCPSCVLQLQPRKCRLSYEVSRSSKCHNFAYLRIPRASVSCRWRKFFEVERATVYCIDLTIINRSSLIKSSLKLYLLLL